jgi:hypothetical protein
MSSSGLGFPMSLRITPLKGLRDSTLVAVANLRSPLEDRVPLRALVLVQSQDAVDAGEKLRHV